MPPADNLPKSPQADNVIIRQFGVSSSTPLRGGVPLSDVMAELEADAAMATHLAAARREMVEPRRDETFRDLRLTSGLSQAKLAERAGTFQSYIARLEAGTVDPGTDMIMTMAKALDVKPERVFCAVRVLRSQSAAAHG